MKKEYSESAKTIAKVAGLELASGLTKTMSFAAAAIGMAANIPYKHPFISYPTIYFILPGGIFSPFLYIGGAKAVSVGCDSVKPKIDELAGSLHAKAKKVISTLGKEGEYRKIKDMEEGLLSEEQNEWIVLSKPEQSAKDENFTEKLKKEEKKINDMEEGLQSEEQDDWIMLADNSSSYQEQYTKDENFTGMIKRRESIQSLYKTSL